MCFAKRQNAFNRFICVLLATAKELRQNDTFANSTDKYICVQVFTGTDWNPCSRCIHSSLTKYSTVHYLVRAKNAWASLCHLVIWSSPHMVTISWSFIAHAENAEATLVSAARWPRSPTQGHLSLHFAYFFFLVTKPILVVRGLICLSSILPPTDRDGVLERPR